MNYRLMMEKLGIRTEPTEGGGVIFRLSLKFTGPDEKPYNVEGSYTIEAADMDREPVTLAMDMIQKIEVEKGERFPTGLLTMFGGAAIELIRLHQSEFRK